jgi:hypothetical protein
MTRRRGKSIRVGDHLIVDDRSGITRWASNTVKDWDGLIVTRGQEDGEHPTWRTRALQDPYPLHEVRPLTGTDFDPVCGHYIMEYIPRTTIKRQLSQNDKHKPLPGIGQMAIGTAANECGHWLVVQEAETSEEIFPEVETGTVTGSNLLTLSHTINLPIGLIPTNDDKRVLVLFASEGLNDLTIPGTWTELLEIQNSTITLHVFYRDIDHTEGFTGADDSIIITTDNITSSSYIVYNISKFDPATAPQISTGATGSDTDANPDEIVFSDLANRLIIAVEAHNTASTTATLPVRYKNQVSSGS